MCSSDLELSKRFFILLYLFLTRHYDKIELVFIRHHTQAQEVNEQDFFHATETGGGGEVLPIGPKVRNMNKDYDYGSGVKANQITHLNDLKLLAGFTGLAGAPSNVDWTDASKPIGDRAKAYLDVNCAHCHNGKGNASQSAGATAHGGLLVIEGDAAARCGISMKGVDIVVGGNVGHMSAFMAQAGRLVIRGDAGEALGDSIYETRIYLRGTPASLGADCVAKEMTDEHHAELAYLLKSAGFEGDDTKEYTRYGSARSLYHFHVDNASTY